MVVESRKPDCQIVTSRMTAQLKMDKLKKFTDVLTFRGGAYKLTFRVNAGSNPEPYDDIYHYSKKLESLVNYQVKVELMAFYKYTDMAQTFRRFDMDLPGFAKYFEESAKEELEHAHAFMAYQAKRGGSLQLYSLPEPDTPELKKGMNALQYALKMERNVTDEVLCLHEVASNVIKDQHFVDFLESTVIPEQYDSMKELKTHIKTLNRMADDGSYGIAEYHFDKILAKKAD